MVLCGHHDFVDVRVIFLAGGLQILGRPSCNPSGRFMYFSSFILNLVDFRIGRSLLGSAFCPRMGNFGMRLNMRWIAGLLICCCITIPRISGRPFIEQIR